MSNPGESQLSFSDTDPLLDSDQDDRTDVEEGVSNVDSNWSGVEYWIDVDSDNDSVSDVIVAGGSEGDGDGKDIRAFRGEWLRGFA